MFDHGRFGSGTPARTPSGWPEHSEGSRRPSRGSSQWFRGAQAVARSWPPTLRQAQLAGVTLVCYDDLNAVDVTHMARFRPIPHLGDSVTVVFLGARLDGVVTHVDDSGRQLTVWTDDGEALSFVLSRATGNFHRDGQQSAARLVFDDA